MAKVMLITGAGRGIGAAVACAAAQAGYDVCVNYHRSADAAGEVVARVRARGREAVAVQADVGRAGDVERL